MKKSLLTAFAVAVAFAASAVTLVNDRPALTAHELNGSLTNVQNDKAKAFKAPAQKAVAMSDVVGTYVMYYQDYFEDGAPTFSEVTVAAGEEDNTLIISGWWASYAEDLTATLDPDAGTITIPRQLIYQYEGDTSADLVNASDTTAAIVGTVYDGEGIVFSGYWGAKLENKTSYYVLGYNTIFFVPNGTMTWKKSNTNYSTSVYLEDDTKSVYVGNFANYGWGINIDLHADKTFTIDPVLVNSSSTGDYYLTEVMTWYTDNNTFAPVNGTGTETALTVTDNYGWTAGCKGVASWYGQHFNTVITRTDGEEFNFPVAPAEITLNVTDEDEVAILPNSTFQLEVISVLPEGADTDVTWSSSDEHLATVDENGLVTGKEFDGYALKNGLNQAPSDNDHFDYFPVTITATAVESDPTAAAPASASVQVWVKSSTRTAVNEVKTAGVESVKYVNAQGMVSSTPFDGVNIEVTRLSDGTTKTVKVIK